MNESESLSRTLKAGGFSLHYSLTRWIDIGFCGRSCILTLLAIIGVLVASTLDGTLILPGRNIGLLEHPGIWAFFGIQATLPIMLRKSLKKLLNSRRKLRLVKALNGDCSTSVMAPLLDFLRLQNRSSNILACAIYGFGLAAFVWNTYQNQLPGIIVPYDFWDSKNHLFGFWITRVYKFYLFVWLLPYVAFLHMGVIVVALRVIRTARLTGRLRLLPFHSDGVGGLGFLPDLVTTPLIVSVLLGSLPAAAAFYIHRAADVTPMMGLTALAFLSCAAYFLPILRLRTDIVAVKRAMIEQLKWQQQAVFSGIFDARTPDFEALKCGSESIDQYAKLCTKINNISHYPHLKRLIGVLSAVVMTPAVGSLIGKLCDDMAPVIQSWLRSL